MGDPKPVRIRPAADADLDAALDYLAERRQASVAALLDEFERAVEQLGDFPQTGSTRIGEWVQIPLLRSLPLDRFPYLLLYFERDDHVDIVRFLHTSRDIPAVLQEESLDK